MSPGLFAAVAYSLVSIAITLFNKVWMQQRGGVSEDSADQGVLACLEMHLTDAVEIL